MPEVCAIAPPTRSRRDYGNLKKKYFTYLLPAAVTQFAYSLSGIVDGIMVANLLDSDALGMINLAGPVSFIYNTIAVLFGMGGSTLYSICRGNHDRDGADTLFSVSLILSTVLGAALAVFGLLFTPQIAALLGGGLEFGDELTEYLSCYFLASVPALITTVFAYFLPAGGHPVLTTVVNVTANGINLLCDFIFIRLLGLGVAGAALATLTGYSVGLLIILAFYIKSGQDVGRLKFSAGAGAQLAAICSTGASTAATQIGYAVKVAFCNLIAAAYAGKAGIVSFSVCMQILNIITMFTGALLSTMQPFLGTLVGMNDLSGAKKVISFTSRIQLLACTALIALFELRPEILTAIYAVEAGAVQDTVIRAIRIFALLFLFRWVYIEFRNEAMILGLKLYALFISLADGFAFLIPTALILCPLIGTDGLWWAFDLSTLLVLAVVFVINRIIAARSGGRYRGFWLISGSPNIIADLTCRTDLKNIGEITVEIEKICREHHMSMSRAMLASISVEEMAVITARSAAPGEAVPMDVLIQKGTEEITIDLLSIGEPFNPTNCREDGEIDSFEMLRRLSRSVTYDYVLGMNTTRIVIAVEENSPDFPGSGV